MSGAAATTIIEHLSATPRDSWHRVGEVAQVENFTPAEIGDAIRELLADGLIEAEPEPLRSRLTELDLRFAPWVDGEHRHLLSWVH